MGGCDVVPCSSGQILLVFVRVFFSCRKNPVVNTNSDRPEALSLTWLTLFLLLLLLFGCVLVELGPGWSPAHGRLEPEPNTHGFRDSGIHRVK